ncbi:hypothetical protein Pcinc_025149 [Petrolisthes cinctipes]|uniref:Uncharacterized protein n=1 Tax=Petrolisthes cinctipes TaxID=88211 RepID=A0AAE1F8L9_PETCI|nr:hypothetical protein Pcinc_025149 [Petrolisthes cinctipes]
MTIFSISCGIAPHTDPEFNKTGPMSSARVNYYERCVDVTVNSESEYQVRRVLASPAVPLLYSLYPSAPQLSSKATFLGIKSVGTAKPSLCIYSTAAGVLCPT